MSSKFLSFPTDGFTTVPNKEPTFTVSPSFTTMLPRTPLVGEGTSTFTLSVSNSTRGSSANTFSPCDFSHDTVASVTDSPNVGTVIFLPFNLLVSFLIFLFVVQGVY